MPKKIPPVKQHTNPFKNAMRRLKREIGARQMRKLRREEAEKAAREKEAQSVPPATDEGRGGEA